MYNLKAIKKQWQIGNLTSGQIAWLIESAEESERRKILLDAVQSILKIDGQRTELKE